MKCSENCKCRPGVVAFIFAPGIMGTRLMNAESGDTVWDPAAGKDYEGQSGIIIENKQQREAELEAAQADDNDGFLQGVGKWFQRRWIGVKETVDNKAEIYRSTKRQAGMVGTITGLIFSGPDGRKKRLVGVAEDGESVIDRNDALLAIDPGTDQYFKTFTPVPPSQIDFKRQCGWGEVLWDSYGPFLNFLEQKTKKFLRYYPGLRFPVFAVGYNWMLSNETAGQRIAERMKQFKKMIIEQDERGITENDIRFIVISHSMGGFASRSANHLAGLQPEIEAIIHGAMPTHGSPDTYNRMRAGQKGVTKLVLGKNAADMTAILGFCQGGLELLPNQLYQDAEGNSEWLFYNSNKAEGHNKEDNISLLNNYGDSIYDFYKQTDLWYSLIQPALLVPELKRSQLTQSVLDEYIEAYQNRIDKCANFHKQLADHFHPITLLTYSDNKEHKSLDKSIWESQDLPDGAASQWIVHSHENHAWFLGDGTVELKGPQAQASYHQQLTDWQRTVTTDYHSAILPPQPVLVSFTLGEAKASGDGTAHEGAGKNPESADGFLKKVNLEASKDHQMFYNCPQVRDHVLVQLADWLPDIHRHMGGR